MTEITATLARIGHSVLLLAPSLQTKRNPRRLNRIISVAVLCLVALLARPVFAAAGDPTIPALKISDIYWTAYEGGLDDGTQQIQGVGVTPDAANAAMSGNCSAANSGYWTYSCSPRSCNVDQCTHSRTSTFTVPGYTYSTTTDVSGPAIKTTTQDYTCDFDIPRSDRAGAVCVCHAGYASNAAGTACVPLKKVFQTNRPPECREKAGNPILPLRGTKVEVVPTGVTIGGVGLVLTYDSSRRPATVTSLYSDQFAPEDAVSFGTLWLSNLHRKLALGVVSSAGSSSIVATRGDGSVIGFKSYAGSITADSDVNERLLAVSGGYRLVDATGQTVEDYDSTGQLARVTTRSGDVLSFAYSTGEIPAVAPTAGLLLQVQDSFGRSVNFTYASIAGVILVNQVTDPLGNLFSFGYDASGNLSAITWPDTKVRTFIYENASFPWALTGVIDENGARYSTFGYDAAGRGISSQHAGGVYAYSTAYYADLPTVNVSNVFDDIENVVYRSFFWQPPTQALLTTPLGSQVSLGNVLINGNPRLTTQSQPGGSGCAASSSSTVLDANGNVASKDDFNGARACYASDLSRNLETARVEGLANTAVCTTVTVGNATLPTGSRKVSTAWHPDWRLETVVAEPGRLTTNVYNGQPDPFNGNAVASCAPSTALLPDGKPIAVLCKRVEQATTDVDGHLGFTAALQTGVANRVQSWTYNQYGQVLTATDPLNHTTTYAYYSDTSFTGTDPNAVGHTIGDLQTLTNAAGQVTTYGSYDKHGNLLQSSDPNGVVTANSYDLRQRLLSTSVGGQTTRYSYDPAGQLLQVTAPDASWIGYEYDPAHRLTSTKDNLGNRIEYTLDNAGNRVAQNVKDPGGNLARTLARSIDALGRVQQTTGRE